MMFTPAAATAGLPAGVAATAVTAVRGSRLATVSMVGAVGIGLFLRRILAPQSVDEDAWTVAQREHDATVTPPREAAGDPAREPTFDAAEESPTSSSAEMKATATEPTVAVVQGDNADATWATAQELPVDAVQTLEKDWEATIVRQVEVRTAVTYTGYGLFGLSRVLSQK